MFCIWPYSVWKIKIKINLLQPAFHQQLRHSLWEYANTVCPHCNYMYMSMNIIQYIEQVSMYSAQSVTSPFTSIHCCISSFTLCFPFAVSAIPFYLRFVFKDIFGELTWISFTTLVFFSSHLLINSSRLWSMSRPQEHPVKCFCCSALSSWQPLQLCHTHHYMCKFN